MRKTLITLAAAASALVVASPAAAQYYSGPAYGYGYNRGGANQWHNELQQIRYQADMLARQGRLTRSESRDLFRDIRSMERAIDVKSRRGLSGYEARQLNDKMGRIRYELRRYSDRDGRRYNRRYW